MENKPAILADLVAKITPEEARIALHKLRQQFEEYEKSYRQQVVDICSKCEHDWHYEPDPSGNNDSGYWCSGCGGWRKNVK